MLDVHPFSDISEVDSTGWLAVDVDKDAWVESWTKVKSDINEIPSSKLRLVRVM